MSDNIINGSNGRDTLKGTAKNDVIDGLGQNDEIIGGGGRDKLFGGDGDDMIDGGTGNDTLDGGIGIDLLSGGADHDLLKGGAEDDILQGDAGNDTLIGGAGGDLLDGGQGRDVFKYEAMSDSAGPTLQRDHIWGFEAGVDKIDLSAIDANTAMKGDQAFAFVAHDPAKPLQAGQVTAHYDVATDRTIVEAAVDNVGGSDMQIELHGKVQLSQQDFVL